MKKLDSIILIRIIFESLLKKIEFDTLIRLTIVKTIFSFQNDDFRIDFNKVFFIITLILYNFFYNRR